MLNIKQRFNYAHLASVSRCTGAINVPRKAEKGRHPRMARPNSVYRPRTDRETSTTSLKESD